METRGADLIIPYNVGHNVRKTNKARIYWYVRSRNIRSSLKMIKKNQNKKHQCESTASNKQQLWYHQRKNNHIGFTFSLGRICFEIKYKWTAAWQANTSTKTLNVQISLTWQSQITNPAVASQRQSTGVLHWHQKLFRSNHGCAKPIILSNKMYFPSCKWVSPGKQTCPWTKKSPYFFFQLLYLRPIYKF